MGPRQVRNQAAIPFASGSIDRSGGARLQKTQSGA
jgi:hypothetical protein